MRKALAASAVAAALIGLFFIPVPGPLSAATSVCDPQRSRLCLGLIDFWDFEEPAGWNRLGSFRDSPLFEKPGVDIAKNTTYYKTGAASIFFNNPTASSQLVAPRVGDAHMQQFTLAGWFKQVNDTGTQTVLATTTSSHGMAEGFKFRIVAGKPTFYAYREETGYSIDFVPSWSHFSTNNWMNYVWTLSPFGPYGKARVCIHSPYEGYFECMTILYTPKVSLNDVTVGGADGEYYKDYMDALLMSSRVWTEQDVAQFYNNNNARAYPFY